MKLLMVITVSLFMGSAAFAASKKKSTNTRSGQSVSIESQSPEVCEHNLASLDRNSSTAYKKSKKSSKKRNSTGDQ